jgi:hypothetical protein
MGRATGEQHRTGPKGTIPEVSFDYLLVTKKGVYAKGQAEESEIILKILVVKEKLTRYVGAHVVPVKGVGADRYAVEKLKNDIMWMGFSRMALRRDNEPVIVALLKEVLKGLKVDAVEQTSEAPTQPTTPRPVGGLRMP